MTWARVRRILIVVISVVLMASAFAACSGLGLVPTPEPVTLRFAYRRGLANYKPLIQAFQEKNPSITVEVVEIDRFGDMGGALRNREVDLFIDSRRALDDAKAGLLKPIGELVAGQWSAIREDYYQGSWEALSLRGQQWGIPAGLDLVATYINRDQHAALHLPVPPQGWELADFLTLANKMNHPEGVPYDSSIKLFGFCTDPQNIDPVIFVYLHGGTIVDSLTSPSQATLDDPLTVEAVQWYSDLFTMYTVAPDPKMIRSQFTRGGYYEAEVRGLCGLWLGNYSSRGGLDTPYRWQADWLMRPLPKDRTPFEVADLAGYFVTAKCAHPEAALKLVRFLADRWESSGQMLPPRRSIAQKEDYLKAVGEDAGAVAKATSDRLIVMPYLEDNAVLTRVGEVFLQAVQQIIAENADPRQALEAAQDRCAGFFQP